jgi:hypothetical protein
MYFSRSHTIFNWPKSVASAFLLLGLALFILPNWGCNRKSRLSVSPVRGRVLYRGQGIANAIVMFTPADDDASEMAKKLRPFAYADGQGNFELKTYRDGDGAPPGKYRVTIMVPSGSSGGAGKDRPGGDAENPAAKALKIPPAVSKKYGSADTSGIEVTVEDGENNLEPFDLAPGAGAPRQSARASSAGAALIRN